MSRVSITQASFASGELDPRLIGRIDLKAQEEGALRLRNLLVHRTGGLSRRPGTRFLAELPGAGRLVSADLGGAPALVALGAGQLRLLRGSTIEATLAAPWDASQLQSLAIARHAGRLLFCHPDLEPHELLLGGDGVWTMRPWTFAATRLADGTDRSLKPFARLAAPEVSVVAKPDGSGSGSVPAGASVVVTASAPSFTPEHYGTWLRIKGRHLRVTSYQSPTVLLALAHEGLPDREPTLDWQEEAFSAARGWPRSLTFFQDRLVIGGSRDMPDRLWMSRTGRPFDFDMGTGLDDEAVGFRLSAERALRITSLVAARQLQVFTTIGEWVVKGFPITPGSVQAELQTQIGSGEAPVVAPVEVDGATLFVPASRRELREFLYADSEQAYQAADLSVLSRHLLELPRALLFDGARRLLLVLREDGALATVTIDRNANVAAWSLQRFDGAVRAAAVHDGEVHLLVEQHGRVVLARLDDTLALDHAVTATSPTATRTFEGLDHLAGREVTVIADGAPAADLLLASGTLTLAEPAREIVCGVRFTHELEPVPPVPSSRTGTRPDAAWRPVRLSFRLLGTDAFTLETALGSRRLVPAADAPPPFTGDLALRCLGWQRGLTGPAWRIRQDDPAAFTLLAITTELGTND
ncbi:hypothetical protein SH611_03090 [Geminicoccaceae bacterium 1502E]|nr:hypothetical protein [Geminicoccaceae bacterium 1502E]